LISRARLGIVADASFTLEDGTQIVYFYGEQSIVSTESSKGGNQSFLSAIEIIAAVAVVKTHQQQYGKAHHLRWVEKLNKINQLHKQQNSCQK
jgi:hypothetical protein